ncbi:MAG: NfeD family protein [Cyanobacteriota bacterium]
MTAIFLNGWIGVIVWLIVAGAFIVFETFTPSFFLIWFAGGAIIAGILSLFGVGEVIQIAVFIITSLTLLAFARPIVKKFVYNDQPSKPSNVYSLIGVKAIVLKPVNQMNGKVKIMNTGEVWSAYTYEHFEPIEENEQVMIEKIDGAKLIVVPKSSYKPTNN